MNLCNILIVDDEAFIVDWLANLLEEQQDLNIFVYRSYNPLEALDLIERTRIDLLISDIQMPSCSGLDLAQKMNHIWPNSKTILLTAYSDFHYAQKAIQLGVISYILKTADDSEILSAVKKALKAIQLEYNQLTLINTIENESRKYQNQINNQLFINWIKGYIHTNFAETIRTLGFDTQNEHFMLIICRPDTFQTDVTQKSQNIMKHFQVQRIIEHYLNPHIIHLYFTNHPSNFLVGIIQLKQNNQTNVHLISETLNLAQNACYETLKYEISFLISEIGKAADIPSFWSFGYNLLPQFNEQKSFIYNYELRINNILRPEDNNKFLENAYYVSMLHYLENGESALFEEQLSTICNYLGPTPNWHNTYTLQIYFSLILVFFQYINKRELATEIAFHISTGILFRPWLAESWTTIESNLYQLTNVLFTTKESAEQDAEYGIIQKIQNYINTHITEDISLLDLSLITGYNSSYLSKYYSDKAGTTITEYIANKKLQKIAQLMKDTDMNISNIATTMGFHSRTYFNNYIKRLTGMSPQQYKEFLLSKS